MFYLLMYSLLASEGECKSNYAVSQRGQDMLAWKLERKNRIIMWFAYLSHSIMQSLFPSSNHIEPVLHSRKALTKSVYLSLTCSLTVMKVPG